MREGEREKERKINYTNKFWPKKLEVQFRETYVLIMNDSTNAPHKNEADATLRQYFNGNECTATRANFG